MMVIYLPVKFEFDWTKRFRVRVRKRKCERTDGRRTHQSNRRVGFTEFHYFFPGLEKSWKLTTGLEKFIKSHEN